MTDEIKTKYLATIGLEIHAELKTKTKMFCSCKNDPDEEKPNSNICSVCTAQPGTLPVLNKKAIEHVLKVGLACGSKIAGFTEWDRKNYFYPDIPKGYQISQYKYPLVFGGSINGVELTRIHLEEDTAKSMHFDNLRLSASDQRESASLVDFNRSGIPLMELVTEPVIHSGKQAADFAKELQLLLQYMGVGDANMEKGEMRVEANISVYPENTDERGLNSRMNADNKDADNTNSKLLYEDLTYKIRGIVFDISNTLGFGHKELVYQNSLEVEFKKQNIKYEKEKNIDVIYDGKVVGNYRPDFLIDNKIILEIKALPFTGSIERKQILHYLNGSEYKLALLINFGTQKVNIERFIIDSIRENPSSYPRKSVPLGTKVEIKNLNSFRTVERAVAYEIERQIEAIEKGEKVIQETRGWDEAKQKTYSQRIKEDSHDYRYFPDPDLPKMMISEVFDLKKIKEELPELPWERREKYLKEFGIKEQDADFFVNNIEFGKFFENVISVFSGNHEKSSGLVAGKDLIKLASNYISSDLVGFISKDSALKIPQPEKFAKIILMISEGKLSSRVAKDLLGRLLKENIDPEIVAEKESLIQKNDEGAVKDIAEKLIKDNPKVVADYKAGKEAALMFFIGQIMKETKGSANPQVIKKVLVELLSTK